MSVMWLQITTWPFITSVSTPGCLCVCVGGDYISMPRAGPQMKHCWGGWLATSARHGKTRHRRLLLDRVPSASRWAATKARLACFDPVRGFCVCCPWLNVTAHRNEAIPVCRQSWRCSKKKKTWPVNTIYFFFKAPIEHDCKVMRVCSS